MPAAVTSIFQRARRAIAGFTMAQRTIAIIGLAVLALGIAALLSWVARPTMTPLFTGLSASDANAVVEQLRSASVSYELTDGGATVLVPEAEVYDQRLAAAAAGLPSDSSDGYSLLDDLGVTTSEFQQSVAYKRAIEGELAATIASLKGVSAASVRLAIPEESVFVSETIDPTASVFVETGRASLTPPQIEAIVHLTSAAVSGLKPENVAVVDQSGRTLSSVGLGATGGVDRQAGDHEARVAESVQALLDRVVGPGNATVTVVAEIDRSVNERLEETYTPIEGGVSSSEHTRTETGTGGQGGAGVLGPDNIAVPSAGDGSYEVTEETRNNLVNKATQTTSTPAGSITRQSVSVAVDAEAGGEIGAGQLSDLVAAAAGIDRTRGDVLTVEMVPFSQSDADAAAAALKASKEAAEAEQRTALLGTALTAVAIAAPLLALVIFLLVRARRRNRQPDEFELMFGERAPSVAAYAGAPAQLEQQLTVPLPLAASEPAPAPPTEAMAELEFEAEPAQVSLERRRGEIESLSRRDPQRTAELLRTMLSDRAGV